MYQVILTEHRDKIPRLSNEPIFFPEEEASNLWHPHKDSIFITLRLAGRKVYRILLDNVSSTDILFKSTLNRMYLVIVKFKLVNSPLYGFTGDIVYLEGVLTMPIEFGAHHCQHIQLVDFMVMVCPSSYNSIIGCLTLNAIQVVTPTYHLVVKFLTFEGIGILKSNQ